MGISSAGTFRSDDGGETFTSKNEGVNSGDEGWCVHGIAHDPAQADTIYRQDHRGVYRTLDGGDSWETIENGLPDDCYANVLRGALALDHESPCGLYFGTTGGSVFASADGGDAFTCLAQDLPKMLCVEAFAD